MKEKSVERWMVDKDGDVIDVRSGQVMACLVDVSVPTRRGQLIAAAPEMYELLEHIRDTATIETPTDVLEQVNTLLAKIEGGGE